MYIWSPEISSILLETNGHLPKTRTLCQTSPRDNRLFDVLKNMFVLEGGVVSRTFCYSKVFFFSCDYIVNGWDNIENIKVSSENITSVILILLYNINLLVQVKSVADAIESIAVNFRLSKLEFFLM